MIKVFVYGSLKKGFHNSELLEDAVFLGEFKTKDYFKMLDLGSYPAIYFDEEGFRVRGELYEIDEDMQRQLDYLEGYPKFYNRKEVDLVDFGDKASIYFFDSDKFNTDSFVYIEPEKGTLNWENKSWKTLFRE
jgi:gamma-glutamylaminecyclotransferase